MPPERAPAIRILGIDPGSHTTGFGLVEQRRDRLHLVDFGAVSCPAKRPLTERLVRIFDGVSAIIERHQPHEVAVEGLFHAKNARSALVLGHARGATLLAVARHHLEVNEYAPREVKKAVVGNGHAEKHQVQAMVCALLGLDRPIRPLDASDGLAIAICHAHSRRLRRAAAIANSA